MGILNDEVVIPDQYNEVPSNEDYTGPCNFETFIDPNSTKDWLVCIVFNMKLHEFLWFVIMLLAYKRIPMI